MSAGAKADGQRLTWAGLTPAGHGEGMAARAQENVEKIPAGHRPGNSEQRYRLRVVDDRADTDELYRYESSRFTDPAETIEHVRVAYPGEYAHGLYELDPAYRCSSGRDWTVPCAIPSRDLPEEEPDFLMRGRDGEAR